MVETWYWYCECILLMSTSNALPGAHFTNVFSIAIQIRWKFRFTLTSILIQWLLQNFVHGTTGAKICCNLMASKGIMAMQSFHRIWIAGKRMLVKRAPWWQCICRIFIFVTDCTSQFHGLFNTTLRGYPAKRALSAMHKHGGYGPFCRIPSKFGGVVPFVKTPYYHPLIAPSMSTLIQRWLVKWKQWSQMSIRQMIWADKTFCQLWNSLWHSDAILVIPLL